MAEGTHKFFKKYRQKSDNYNMTKQKQKKKKKERAKEVKGGMRL